MSSRAEIARNVVLDGRFALFHKPERWLAVADLHFGYELSQRAAGNLFPLWGMQTIEARLLELISDYRPEQLILVGDLVHNRAGAQELGKLLERLSAKCGVIMVAGNHDRQLREFEMRETWETKRFHFHHGHCAAAVEKKVQIIGH